jgi:hypothetical protein
MKKGENMVMARMEEREGYKEQSDSQGKRRRKGCGSDNGNL